MKKNYIILITSLIFCFILTSGCTSSSNKVATIKVNSDSEYMNTFDDLNLGKLYNFVFNMTNADNKWVNVWVESYKNGIKDPQPITSLSYGVSLEQLEKEKGNLGFGIINDNTDAHLVFLYSPNLSTTPLPVEVIHFPGTFRGWDYAIGDEKVELQLGETYLLGSYRQSSEKKIRQFNLQDETELMEMLNEDSMVLLLKIEIVENNG